MVFLKIAGMLCITVLVLLILAGIIIFIKEVKNAPTFSDDYDFPFT